MSEATEILPLFVYGTLMDMANMEVALARIGVHAGPHSPIMAEEAVLPDFQVFKGERGQGWPYIVPRPGAQAQGQLVSGLSAKDMWRLDIHESAYDPETDTTYPLFARQRVTVKANGRAVECDTYMPVFENWHGHPNWRNREEAEATAKSDPIRQSVRSPPVADLLDKAKAGS